jgi:hypothetical protein
LARPACLVLVQKFHHIKSNHRVLRRNEVDTLGTPVLAPDYSAIVLAANMCTNSKSVLCILDFHDGIQLLLKTGFQIIFQSFPVLLFAVLAFPRKKIGF